MSTASDTTFSGFDALGHPVSESRLSQAYRLLKSWGIGTEDAMRLVGRIAHYIERDEPYKALYWATGGAPLPKAESNPAPAPEPFPADLPRIDVTGGYRLFAVLCAGGS